MTLETFNEWKQTKRRKKMEELEESNKAAMKKGKGSRTLSGRALFHYDPSLFVDDEGVLLL